MIKKTKYFYGISIPFNALAQRGKMSYAVHIFPDVQSATRWVKGEKMAHETERVVVSTKTEAIKIAGRKAVEIGCKRYGI